MRIDSGTVGMESARSYHASTTSVRRFMITEYQQAFNTFTAAGEEQYDETSAAWQDKRGEQAKGAELTQSTEQDQMLESLEDTENVKESRLEQFWNLQNRYGVKTTTV